LRVIPTGIMIAKYQDLFFAKNSIIYIKAVNFRCALNESSCNRQSNTIVLMIP
jgi:hypothetical protein